MNVIPTTGYHGTYIQNVDSIIENNFRISADHNKWFGDGVYFFVSGLFAPLEAAQQFVNDQSQRYGIKDEIIVMEATINVDNDAFLDMTQNDGLQLVNSFRDEMLAAIETIGLKPTSIFKDFDVIRSMRKELGIEFVKGNVYIRFGIQRRDRGFHSIIPNVTIFAVGNPEKNIDKASIKRVA